MPTLFPNILIADGWLIAVFCKSRFYKKQSDKTSRAAASTVFVRDVFLEKFTFKAYDLSSATVSSFRIVISRDNAEFSEQLFLPKEEAEKVTRYSLSVSKRKMASSASLYALTAVKVCLAIAIIRLNRLFPFRIPMSVSPFRTSQCRRLLRSARMVQVLLTG